MLPRAYGAPVNPRGSSPPAPKSSSSGNRTPGVCVTGRNVTNYTNEDRRLGAFQAAAPRPPLQGSLVAPRNHALPPPRQSIPPKPKSDTFSIFACHPCAGAMLIFSVSFQFLRMMPKHSEQRTTLHPYPRPEASPYHYGGALKHASKNCSVAPKSITERGIG